MTKIRLLLGLAGLLSAAVGGYLAASATAAGPPTNPNETLFYAGFVTDASGAPVDGSYSMSVDVFDDNAATQLICSTSTLVGVPINNGHFRVPLPSDCVDAFKSEPDTWLRLTISGEVMPVTRVGAVPYALEAGHATTATTATNADNATSAVTADNAITASSVEWDDVANKPAIGTYTNGGVSWSNNALPCGPTASSVDGDMGGYAGAKALCETACGTTTAHMCTAHELVRFTQTGGSFGNPSAWIASGMSIPNNDNTLRVTDCAGWTSSEADLRGPQWVNNGPTTGFCATPKPVLCCD